MTEQNPATDNATDQVGEVAGQNPQEGEANKEQETGLSPEAMQAELKRAREEAARYRSERNELRSDAEAWREKQESEKSELQRAQEALAERDRKLNELSASHQRLQVAAQFGIAQDNLDLLGSDPDKFEANAQRLAEMQEAAAKRQSPPSDAPVEDLRPGASEPAAAPDYSYPTSWPVNGRVAN